MELITHTFVVENLHCEGCERSINDLLSNMDSRITEVHVSLHDDTVSVVSPKEISSRDIARVLDKAGFDVVITDVSEDPGSRPSSSLSTIFHNRWGNKVHNWQKSRAHLEKCDQCRQKAAESSNKPTLKKALHYFDNNRRLSGSTVGGEQDDTEDENTGIVMDGSDRSSEYRAIYSVGDMTCASCTTAITSAVNQQIPEISIGVDLMNKSAVAIVPDKKLALKIQEVINDIGYTCELVELVPIDNAKSWQITASIGGMTCMSCVSAIKDQIEPLPFVQEVDISLLTNSATFVINELKKADELKERVEDIGYEYDLVEINEISYSSKKKISRTVNLAIRGMFCE